MDEQSNYIELVEQAQLGNRESLDDLAGLARGRLYAYVYRIVLQDDLAQDIVQESMLEMFKVLGNLERADRFWPWLRGIAFNKIRWHHRQKQRYRQVPISNIKEPGDEQKDGQTGLAKLVSEELKQIVFAAMGELKPRHRKVLTMRCYEEMKYSEIAALMGCSEVGVRVLFYRAKRSLQKALSRKGFGRGFLLMALVLFGKMTAPSEAAAVQVSITAATVRVGAGAALLGMVSSKTAVVSLTTAGVLAVGTIMTTSGPDETTGTGGKKARSIEIPRQVSHVSEDVDECWYYFPEGADGPVMMRIMKSDSGGKQSYCAWRQNDRANYHFDKRKNTISISNHRLWRSDLAVWRLPTDKADLREFLSQVEGRSGEMEYVHSEGDGLLVIARQGRNESGNRSQIVYHHHVLDEEYFRYDWPVGIKKLDNRDPMHKRCWTCFTISGEINGQRLSGGGRIPFVYAASKKYGAWLRIKVGNRLKVVDSDAEALVYAGSGEVAVSYPAGSFFKGLARPWMGLHTIDSVRRDAAEEGVWFETKLLPGGSKAEVVLTYGQTKLVYSIDMEADVIDKITFLSEADEVIGQLEFSYMQDIKTVGNKFAEPKRRSYRQSRQKSDGILWLFELISEK